MHIIAESAFSDLKYCFLEVKVPKSINNYGILDVECKDDSTCIIVQKGD